VQPRVYVKYCGLVRSSGNSNVSSSSL